MKFESLAVDRTSADLAAELIAIFGASAGQEAARRADRSRDAGNAIRFCTWRQAERLIILLSTSCSHGTVH